MKAEDCERSGRLLKTEAVHWSVSHDSQKANPNLSMKKKKYPWEIGTKLAAEIQAKDTKAARKLILALVNIIWQESGQRSFDEVKLRVLQVLTIANRAAYYAGANPERLCNTNINLVKRMITVRTKRQLLALIKHVVTEFIALVPDRDFLSSTRLDKAISYIREHCTEGISRLMTLTASSPSHLGMVMSIRMMSGISSRAFSSASSPSPASATTSRPC